MNLLSCLSWNFHLPLLSDIGSPGSQALECGLELYYWLSRVNSLQVADHGTARPP